ncbi:MAG: hypothetical protein K2Y40_04725 [Reyranella sp.]|nr:hypothetical protein [Reyranella sp.]
MSTDVMQPIDIADTLDPVQWEALKALCAPSPDPRRLSATALEQLRRSELVEPGGDRPVLSAKGRQVVICGSPRLWNS